MKRIKYTPDAADRLRSIKKEVGKQYGTEKAKAVVKRIMTSIDDLVQNERKGPSVEEMFDIDSDYRYLVKSPNYVFYKIEDTYIKIINIYHEKEDFMWHLFGIDTTPQESIDYWKE